MLRETDYSLFLTNFTRQWKGGYPDTWDMVADIEYTYSHGIRHSTLCVCDKALDQIKQGKADQKLLAKAQNIELIRRLSFNNA